MDKQKLQMYLAAIFIVAVFIGIWFLKPQDDYSIIPLEIGIERVPNFYANNRPELAVLDNIPHYTSNDYFDIEIYPELDRNENLYVVLYPKFRDMSYFDSVYETTKNEVLDWIISQGTLISDINIDWYVEVNDYRSLIDQS